MNDVVPDEPRIYLDNAATSFPKPAVVHAATEHYSREVGVAVGRGSSRRAGEVRQTVARCRLRAAQLLGAGDPSEVVFTFNGTDSLNQAIHGLLQAGDHVVTSEVEHNSVLRPLRELERRGTIELTCVPADAAARVDPSAIRRALRAETRLGVLQHASNVTGVIQPIEEVGQIARAGGAVFLVDAAQSVGHLPLNVRALPVDLLACPGHKGLLGPLGTGLLWLRPGLEQRLQPVRQGGTGTRSEEPFQPEELPERLESGNHNAPGLYGLDAALGWLLEEGIPQLAARERELTERLLAGLGEISGVRIAGPEEAADRVGVVSFTHPGYEPQVLASLLDEAFGVESRAGLHCAPGAHRAAGTFERGGTVRLSCGPFTTQEDIDAAIDAVSELAGSV